MPLIRKLRRMTTPPTPALTFTPFVPDARMEATWPPPPSSVIDLVIDTVPKPPGSSASISPPVAVFEMAPGQVLHGAVRLHGLASSPTPETQVRVACACAGAIARPAIKSAPANVEKRVDFLIVSAPGFRSFYFVWIADRCGVVTAAAFSPIEPIESWLGRKDRYQPRRSPGCSCS